MKITLHAAAEMPAGIEETFELATDPGRFPEFFPGNLVIPAVLRVELQGAPPPAPGMLRLVHNADKTCITERVEAFDVPREHHYRLVDGFVPPSSWMIREAEGRWLFRESASGTHVDWYYTFHLTHPLAALLAWPLLGIFFTAAMRHCLRSMGQSLA